MSRLIDADDFKKFLQALCRAGAPYEEVVQLLDKQSTSFDTEKVVEQLEERKGNVFIDGKKMYQEDYFIDIDDAIDIVKKGGVE